PEAREVTDQGLGLGGFELGIFDDDEIAVLGLGRERVLESHRAHLLRQVRGMRANHRPEGTAAAAELRHAGRAMASAARTLLLVHLLAGAPDLGAALGLVRAGLALVELPLHAARKDVLARLETKDLVRQLDRACGLAFERRYLEFHVMRPPSQ